MPRSSRHKSTKHSSREVREYSDSEKDSNSKDRKGGGEAGGGEERVSSDRVSSGEKRKQLESSKDDNNNKNNNYNGSTGSRNGEEHSSSKRRKERVDDAVSDRWNGRGDDDRGGAEGTKKSKDKSSESSSLKRRRRDENEGLLLVKKSSSSGKSEGKHKESNKAERERDKDRDRKAKAERFVDGEDPCAVKHLSQKTDFDVDLLRSPESGIQLDRQRRRRRDGSSDRDKYQDDVDIDDKLYSSKEDFSKDVRLRNEKYKEERYKEKYHVDRECKYHESKQKDERVSTDYNHNRLDDKHLRDEKETTEIWPNRSKPQDGKYDHERDDDLDCDLRWDCENYHDKDHENYHDRDCHCIRDHEHDLDYECDHELCRDCEHNRDRVRDPNLDRDWDWDQDRDRDKDCDQDSDHDKDKEYEQNMGYDGADDEGISKHKDSWKEMKRSLDDYDDYIYGKSKVIQACYPNVEKNSFSSNKVETDMDRGRSQARQPQQDNIVSGNRRRTCPSTCSADEYRHFKPDKLKYRDAVTEQWPKTVPFSEVISFPGASERASKYRSSERSTKLDDVHMGDLSSERSTSKTSPMGLVDRSPLSGSLERRYTIRSTRQSLDIEESVRRSNVSVSARDLTPREDSSTCDMPLEKPLVDDYIPAVSAFYSRTSQGNPALTPGFRGGVGSPFISRLEEGGRTNSGTGYKRSSEPNFGRGQGSTWRGGPNWSSPMPNGYIPFQHGPPHASFHTMMPQFPSPPLFGVRPSMEVNHSGIPYHVAEADRFSGLLRPLGWQNMMDGSGPTHVHGWDGNSGVYRDEMPMYGGPEWEQSKHPVNGREWESSVDNCKGKNGDAKIDLPLKSLKEDNQKQASIDALFSGKEGQKPENENGYNGVQDRALETKPAVSYSVKEASKLSTFNEIITYPPKLLGDFNNPHSYRAYLSKLDISTELVGPDLFRQFMAFLNVGHRTVVDEKVAMLVNLKVETHLSPEIESIVRNISVIKDFLCQDGARAVPKSSNKLLSPSLFSATNNTVHKRALDIYKNQKLVLHGFPSVNTGLVDGKLAFKEEEQVLVTDENKAEELLLNCQTEMSNVILDFDPVKSEAASVATGLKSKELVSSTGQLHIHAYDPCENLDVLDRSLSHDDSLKSTQVVRGDQIDEISSKMVSDSHNLDESCKFHSAEDEDLHHAMSDSLLFSDGSSKVSGALMPGSSESELVILTRIHHSPKSTH